MSSSTKHIHQFYKTVMAGTYSSNKNSQLMGANVFDHNDLNEMNFNVLTFIKVPSCVIVSYYAAINSLNTSLMVVNSYHYHICKW